MFQLKIKLVTMLKSCIVQLFTSATDKSKLHIMRIENDRHKL